MCVVQASADVLWANVVVVVVLTALGVNVHAQALTTCGVRASAIVMRRHSCPMACGIFPDQGWNPCPLHWQEDS